MPNNKLNFEHVTSPPKKKAIIHSKILIVEVEDDEERTHLEEIRRGAGEEEKITTRHVSFGGVGLNIKQVIDTITIFVHVQHVEQVARGIGIEVLIAEKV
jgi:hypothetical protein